MGRRFIMAIAAAGLLLGCGVSPASVRASSAASLAARDTTPSTSIENFGQVVDPGHPAVKLYRGGIPSHQGLQELKGLGVSTVVCLLDGSGKDAATVADEKQATGALGLKWVNLVVPYGVELPRDLAEQFIAIATDPSQTGVYVHCKKGKDRTGEMVAAYRIRFQGYTAEQAIAEMQQYHYTPNEFPWVDQFVSDFAKNSR
jgi:protein tyrosine/serine phosphatase